MDTKLAARFLGISVRALWRLKQRHLVPRLRIDKRVMYERAALERWIISHRVLKPVIEGKPPAPLRPGGFFSDHTHFRDQLDSARKNRYR
jgi:hypothetical protein